MLLEVDKPIDPPRVPGRSSSMRVVSKAGSSSTARGRVGSMIVHDMEEEEEDSEGFHNNPPRTSSPVQAMHQDTAGPSTRRKVKETQLRLGVGRPVAIGGSGARAPSSSKGKPRSRRGKPTAVVKPSEADIPEEAEEEEDGECGL